MKIIAEIGLNHCGSVERANNLVQELNKTSADTISFQIREKEFYDKTNMKKISFAKDQTENEIRKENFIYSFLSSIRQKMLSKRK